MLSDSSGNPASPRMKRKRFEGEEEDVAGDTDAPVAKRAREERTMGESIILEARDEEAATPMKRKRGRPPGSKKAAAPSEESNTVTPMKRKRGRPPGSKNKPKAAVDGLDLTTPTDDPFATPTKTHAPSRNADRSARRKSARTVIALTVADDLSEDDVDEEDLLARRIWDEEDEEDDLHEESNPLTSVPATPSKRGRGRPKGSKNRRSPTPPTGLPPHERYFHQNRPGGVKTSNHTMSGIRLLDHEEYFSLMRDHVDPHRPELDYLHGLHTRSFGQWRFEMAEGFNVCLYGWGSKRKLAMDYAEWLSERRETTIVVVNGYTPALTVRDILTTLASTILPPEHPRALGSQPAEMLSTLLGHLTSNPTPVTLMIHSLDAPPLRRPTSQSLLARLASHASVSLLATADHPSFPLLWPAPVRESYNFLFHDTTTFSPHSAAELDVVDTVHGLLGRSGRRVAGKEGVGFVLKSLPENARSLFRVLVAEQLAALEEGVEDGAPGVEYRALYSKAAEEFICSNEMSFRTLLKEFHDHQMILSSKDSLASTGGGGAEMLSVPFARAELEAILEDLI
ncbi:MAG: Origin recognition complex subunit 2 [Thelocarpon impressellum]|nr:MAG: Origin recognition complex subunit 2 [Thelocarpon impressellum]